MVNKSSLQTLDCVPVCSVTSVRVISLYLFINPLLMFDLFILSILAQILSSDFDHHINIDIIGVEKEVELIPIFKVRFGSTYNVTFNLVRIVAPDSSVARASDKRFRRPRFKSQPGLLLFLPS